MISFSKNKYDRFVCLGSCLNVDGYEETITEK